VLFFPFVPGASFPNQALIEGSSIAVWNKNKIIMVIAGGIWLSNVAASIEGKPLLPTDYWECQTNTIFPQVLRG